MKIKRFLAQLLSAVLCMTLAGCYGNESDAKKNIAVSPTVCAVFSGISAAVSALCFCGVKNNFYRVKRNTVMTCVASAVLVLIAIAAFLGFAV